MEINFSLINSDLGTGVQTMSPIPPNKGPDEPSQPVANENQQIINDEAENEEAEDSEYQLLSQNPGATGAGENGQHRVESHDDDDEDDEDDEDSDDDDDEPFQIDPETGFELLASSRANIPPSNTATTNNDQTKFDNSNLFEVDVFQQRNQLECEDIVLDESKSQEINKIMSNFQLPDRCIPEWAKLVPENVWKRNLLETLNAKKTDLFDSMPSEKDSS